MLKTTARKRGHASEYDLQGDLDKIKIALADAALSAKGTAGEALKQSWDNAIAKSEEIEEFAKDRPYKTVGLAMVIGGIIGFLARGRKK